MCFMCIFWDPFILIVYFPVGSVFREEGDAGFVVMAPREILRGWRGRANYMSSVEDVWKMYKMYGAFACVTKM